MHWPCARLLAEMLCHMTLCELCHLWRLLLHPTSQPTIAPTAENIAQILWGWFSRILFVSGLGFRMVVLDNHSFFYWVHTSISSQPCPAITAKIAIVMISVSKWHLVLSTLGSFTCVKYSWNLLVMSKLSTLGIKDVSVFLFFSSQILLTLLWACC